MPVATNVPVVVAVPSLTVTVMVADPTAAGVNEIVRLAPVPLTTMLPLGTTAWSDEVAVTTRLPAGVWASPTVIACATDGVPTVADWLTSAESVGGVFGGVGFEVTLNEVLEVAPLPSCTVTVMVAVPAAIGVTLTVRLAPAPPSTMAPLGTTAWLDEVAVTIRAASGVSVSVTVNAAGVVAVPTVVVWPAIGVICGGVFGGSRTAPSRPRRRRCGTRPRCDAVGGTGRDLDRQQPLAGQSADRHRVGRPGPGDAHHRGAARRGDDGHVGGIEPGDRRRRRRR